MKVGIADYGMNVWDGGACFDWEERLLQVRRIGYAGIERLTAASGEHALEAASVARRHAMDFATVRAATPELSIRYTAALGKRYVWTHVDGKKFDAFCRQVNIQAAACERWGIRVALHNHLGTPVENEEQLEAFLDACPTSLLVFDTAHLAAAGGDPERIAAKHADRFAVIHAKDWIEPDPGNAQWTKRVRFCGLGRGKLGDVTADVVRAAERRGFDGWILVEHDTHLREPQLDLEESRQYLRDAGW